MLYLAYLAVRERKYQERYESFLHLHSPDRGDALDLSIIQTERAAHPNRFSVQASDAYANAGRALMETLRLKAIRATHEVVSRFMPARSGGSGSFVSEGPNTHRRPAFDKATKVSADARWDTLVLPEATKHRLLMVCELLKNAAKLPKGITLPRGVLLWGPPGTGKTQVARTIANEAKVHFVSKSIAELKGEFLGKSDKRIKDLFDDARANTPAIVFIDELDMLVPARGPRNDDIYAKEMLGEMLQQLDGAEERSGHVLLIAATNDVEALDAALLSRFPTQIEIPLPDEVARASIFAVLLASKPVRFDLATTCRDLGVATAGLSGRDIRTRVEQAEQAAVYRAMQAGTLEAVCIERVDLGLAQDGEPVRTAPSPSPHEERVTMAPLEAPEILEGVCLLHNDGSVNLKGHPSVPHGEAMTPIRIGKYTVRKPKEKPHLVFVEHEDAPTVLSVYVYMDGKWQYGKANIPT